MTPREYEKLAAEFFERRGYVVELQRGVGDWGVDLFASQGDVRLAVQVKMYGDTKRPVNRAMIMQLEGARRYFDCTHAALVTDGRVLSDAQKVAEKLAIDVHSLVADSGALPQPQTQTQAESELHFDKIWSEHIMPLGGKTLENSRGTNQIVAVDWSGVHRITSRGGKSFVRIETFRNVVNRLLQGEFVGRDEINAEDEGRVSAAVCLILSQVPFIHYGGKPGGLRVDRKLVTAPTRSVGQTTLLTDEERARNFGEE